MFHLFMHYFSTPLPPVWYWHPPINIVPPPLPHPSLVHFFRR